jgi:CheY-like chemotaxis protein
VGLGERELSELLDRLDQSQSEASATKREFVRWAFRCISVRVQIIHPGGATASINVACRNLSRSGLSMLHSAYLHVGTKCRVHLPHPARGEIVAAGWVTRCNHCAGTIHEIGIRFDQPVDLKDLVHQNPFTDWFSLERVEPEKLSGTVVYVDDSEMDQRIIRHFLRATRVKLCVAATAAEALSLVDSSTDLVLTDYNLDQGTGLDLAVKLQESGCKAPVVVITCDTDAASLDKSTASRASAFLAKPIQQDLLLRALAEFLIVRKSGAPAPAANAGLTGADLAETFGAGLIQFAKRLEACVERQDAEATRLLCLQVAGSAGSIGMAEIASLAKKAAEAISRSRSIADSVSPIRALIAMCQRGGVKQVNPAKPSAERPAA